MSREPEVGVTAVAIWPVLLLHLVRGVAVKFDHIGLALQP